MPLTVIAFSPVGAFGGRVLVATIDEKAEDGLARAWLANLGDPYERVGTDQAGDVAINWGVYGAPETFLVDPQGIVVAKQVGAMTAAKWQEWSRLHLAAGGADAAAGAR